MSTKNPHDGHRKRVRKEMTQRGIDEYTPPKKILEFILFHSQPRCDTNPIADRLLDRFYDLPGVLDADPEDLMEIEGISDATVLFLKNIIPIVKAYEWHRTVGSNKLRTSEDVLNFLHSFFLGRTEEIALLVCLDGNDRVINVLPIGKGDIGSVGISARTVVKMAISNNATQCIIAHNHPSGITTPSINDIDATIRIKNALATIGVLLKDHIIAADEKISSVKTINEYRDLFDEIKHD